MKNYYHFYLSGTFQILSNDCGLASIHTMLTYYKLTDLDYADWICQNNEKSNPSLSKLEKISNQYQLKLNFLDCSVEQLISLKFRNPIFLLININKEKHIVILYKRFKDIFYCFCPSRGKIQLTIENLYFLFGEIIGISEPETPKETKTTCTQKSRSIKHNNLFNFFFLMTLKKFYWIPLFLVTKLIFYNFDNLKPYLAGIIAAICIFLYLTWTIEKNLKNFYYQFKKNFQISVIYLELFVIIFVLSIALWLIPMNAQNMLFILIAFLVSLITEFMKIYIFWIEEVRVLLAFLITLIIFIYLCSFTIQDVKDIVWYSISFFMISKITMIFNYPRVNWLWNNLKYFINKNK